MAAVGPVRPHSPISCPGSRLCQDSHLGGCTASERCQQHLPDFSFPWDVGPGHANAYVNSNCPLSQCRLTKEKLQVRIFHLKGQENFGLAVKLQMCMAAARRRGKEASSVGHRERLLTTSSSRQQAISAFQGRCTAIDFPLTYQSKLGIIPSQLI